MALRQIRKRDDEILYKKCKDVVKFDKKLHILLDDMYDTMKKSNGVGLAAPQVGILKRVAVIDISEDSTEKIEIINPEIIAESGEQTDKEGCLSFPDVFGKVTRPKKVTVKAQDRDGNFFEVKGEGLLARAFCHEIDHLDGKVFIDKVTEFSD